MSARAFSGLCLRPALAAALAIVAALVGAIVFVDHTLSALNLPNGARVFQLAYNTLTCALLVSAGSFAARLTAELAAVRIAKTIPGLRRKMAAQIMALVPLAAVLAVAFLAWAVPAQFSSVSYLAMGCLSAFLFALGLGLGRSRLISVVLLLLIVRYDFIAQQMEESPAAISVVALVGATLLVAIWHARFLPRPTHHDAKLWQLLGLKTGSTDALARRTGEPLRDVATWNENTTTITLGKLLKAGVHERLGHRLGKLPGALASSVLGAYALFALILAVLASKAPGANFVGFLQDVFVAEKSNQWITVARVAFAVITGMAGYVGAMLIDTSIRPELWHPISRQLKARAIFWSRLRQNGAFAMAHAFAAFLLVSGFGLVAGKLPSLAVYGAFLMPAVAGFLLAPIPQALFPHGGETFHAKANPLVQLGAGLMGGAYCLMTVYWTSHWPTKVLHPTLSTPALVALFAAAAFAIYGTYWACVSFRYTRIDLSRRAL